MIKCKSQLNQYPDIQTLYLLRHCAENDPDEEVRELAIHKIAKDWKELPDTSNWLKIRAKSDPSANVVHAVLQELARGWKDDPATLNWFKTYAQYSRNAVVRRAAVQELARGWKNEPNVFEILCKCAVVDPFKRNDNSEVNPRQTALLAIIEQYPDYSQTLRLLSDRAERDPDKKVREFAKEKLKQWSQPILDFGLTLLTINFSLHCIANEQFRHSHISYIMSG